MAKSLDETNKNDITKPIIMKILPWAKDPIYLNDLNINRAPSLERMKKFLRVEKIENHIADFRPNPFFLEFDFYVIYDPVDFEQLKKDNTLDCSGLRISIELLSKYLVDHKEITELRLVNCGIENNKLLELLINHKDALANITHIDLSCNHITAQGLTYATNELSKLTNLKSCELSNNIDSSDTIDHLQHNLANLLLTENNIYSPNKEVDNNIVTAIKGLDINSGYSIKQLHDILQQNQIPYSQCMDLKVYFENLMGANSKDPAILSELSGLIGLINEEIIHHY